MDPPSVVKTTLNQLRDNWLRSMSFNVFTRISQRIQKIKCSTWVSLGFTAGAFSGDAIFGLTNNMTWETRMWLITKSKTFVSISDILPSELSWIPPILVGKLKNDLVTRQLEAHLSAYRLNDTNNFFKEQDANLFQTAISNLLSVNDTSWLFSGANESKLVVQYMKYVGLEVDHWLSNFKGASTTDKFNGPASTNGIDGPNAATSLLKNYFRHLKAFLKKLLEKDIDDEDLPIDAIKNLWKTDILLPIAVGRAYYLLGRCYLEDKKFDVAHKYFTIAEELSTREHTFKEQEERGAGRANHQPTPIEVILSRRSGLLVCDLLKVESKVNTLAQTTTTTMNEDVQRCIERLKNIRRQYAELHEDERVFYDIMSDTNVCLRTDHIHQAECTNQIVKTLLLELRLYVACRCLSGVKETMIKIMDLLSRSDDDFSLLNGVGRWRGTKRQRLYLLNLAEMLTTISTVPQCAAMWPAAATGILFVKDISTSLWHQPLLDQLLRESPETAAKRICERIIDERAKTTASGIRDRAKAEAEKLLQRLSSSPNALAPKGTDST